MKWLLSLFLIHSLSPLWVKDDCQKMRVAISSSINIVGSSNISSFCCNFQNADTYDTLDVQYSNQGNFYSLDNVMLEIDITSFDCGNKIMNKDFCDMLQEQTYPSLKIYLKEVALSTERVWSIGAIDTTCGKVKLIVELAGRQRNYELPFHYTNQGTTSLIQTSIAFNINDFQLTPPEKLLGLIKVREQTEIAIRCNVNQLISDSN